MIGKHKSTKLNGSKYYYVSLTIQLSNSYRRASESHPSSSDGKTQLN